MRYFQWLTPLVAVFALVAFTPNVAHATDQIQAVNEDTGVVCGSTQATGCNVHLTGAFELRIDLGIFGEVDELHCELEVQLTWTGWSWKIWKWFKLTPGNANCQVVLTTCNFPWGHSGEEDGAVGIEQGAVTLCLDPAETDIANCQGNVPMAFVEGANEALTMVATNLTAGLCEFDIDLAMEHAQPGNVEIHLNHP
jgi:hypothetical protein